MANYKHTGMTVTTQNYIHSAIRSNYGKASRHSDQNLLSYHAVSKNISVKI
jgi:hypothetical protein